MVKKYSINQRIRIKTENGPHKEPPSDCKGSLGTIAEQSTSDWLGSANSIYVETPHSYYVVIDDGPTEVIGEDWLEPA